MNTISWFIYLSDVLGNLGNTLSACTGICVFILGTFSLLTITSFCSKPKYDWDGEDFYGLRYTFKKCMLSFLVLVIFLIIANVVVPSKSTMLMIAASQTAEQVAVSPQGQQILNNLENVINNKLKEMSK